MRHLGFIACITLTLVACGGSQAATSPVDGRQASASSPANEFVLRDSDTARFAHGATPSKIKPTRTEAALKFIVVDKDTGPVAGVVISLTAPDGTKYYTEETDATGYAEVLVPAGQKYDLVYLTLGRRDIAAAVPVSEGPNQTLKLTLRYKRYTPPQPAPLKVAAVGGPVGPAAASDAPVEPHPAPRFVLKGVHFDIGKATIRGESFPRLDSVVEYMTHKKSSRIEISGHTDNMGDPGLNRLLSEKRALACRDYLISKGIEASRIEAVGYGDARPIAPNETDAGRQKNRRIEVTEL